MAGACEQGPMAGASEHGNENSIYIKREEILELLSDKYLLNMSLSSRR
jgi:hypothetical protein